uniref:Uncharacterized protein n=1 Tax=Cucumis melo TaxID=3656 RepID=A0A9I9DRE5_CUCME
MTTCKVELSGARMTQQEADRRARLGTEADNSGERKNNRSILILHDLLERRAEGRDVMTRSLRRRGHC